MTKYTFELEGISDLKMDSAATMELPQPKNPEGYIKQAEMKVYKDDKGNISIPASALKAALKLASSDIGKKMEAKEASMTVKPKGVGMNLKPKKFEYTEAEMEEKYGSKKHEYKRKDVKGVEKKAGEKDGHYKDYEKEETKEAARTYGMGSKEGRGLRKGITNNRNYVYGKNGVNEEIQTLREKNEEYRKALNIFREKLNEVAVFNSNLAYATRLFTEHTTTKQEKINILRRFDDVESLKESKSLYSSIKNELNTTNSTQSVVTESIERIGKSPASGSSQNLIESKTYENPQFLRMKDIMQKIQK
jgi:hypothetical protein